MKKLSIIFLLILGAFCFNYCQPVVNTGSDKPKTPPEWSCDAAIYEVNVRQFTEEGSFAAFKEHLPRLKNLGVKILWFMPIHPIGELNRKGGLGSYYAVKDYKAVNPEFGTIEEFKELVKKIHDMDMYVIIDWVANHSAWDNVWVQDHPDFYTKDSSGSFVPPAGTDWSDVIDFDYNNATLREYMLDALKFWVRECDIDGYRCDVAAMVPIEFWNTTRKELDKIKPVFMLAEAHEPELHEQAFDMTYNWNLKDIMNGIAGGNNTAADLISHIKEEDEKYPADAFRMTFTTNHDENSWAGTVYERLGDAAETFAVLTGTVEGMILVYSGQEAGLNKRLSFFEKDFIEWKEHKNFEIYTKLLELKKVNKALWNGERGGQINLLNTSGNENVLAFVRESNGDKILAILNLSAEPLTLEIHNEMISGTYTDLFNDDSVTFTNSEIFDLPGWGYRVYYK